MQEEETRNLEDITEVSGVSPRWRYLKEASIGRRVSHAQSSNNDLDFNQPEICIHLISRPSVGTLTKIKQWITQSPPGWLGRFLQLDGLEILLHVLEKLCSIPSLSLSDTILQVECVECVRTVMNSQSGLDCILENKDFVGKFAKGNYILLTINFNLSKINLIFLIIDIS